MCFTWLFQNIDEASLQFLTDQALVSILFVFLILFFKTVVLKLEHAGHHGGLVKHGLLRLISRVSDSVSRWDPRNFVRSR